MTKLTKKLWRQADILANPSAVKESLNAQMRKGTNRNKKKPDIRCKIETIAGRG